MLTPRTDVQSPVDLNLHVLAFWRNPEYLKKPKQTWTEQALHRKIDRSVWLDLLLCGNSAIHQDTQASIRHKKRDGEVCMKKYLSYQSFRNVIWPPLCNKLFSGATRPMCSHDMFKWIHLPGPCSSDDLTFHSRSINETLCLNWIKFSTCRVGLSSATSPYSLHS